MTDTEAPSELLLTRSVVDELNDDSDGTFHSAVGGVLERAAAAATSGGGAAASTEEGGGNGDDEPLFDDGVGSFTVGEEPPAATAVGLSRPASPSTACRRRFSSLPTIGLSQDTDATQHVSWPGSRR